MHLYSSSCITIFKDSNFKSEGWMQGSCCSTLQHTIYVSCIRISNPNNNILQPCPVMVDTVRSLPPEPTLYIIYARAAQTEVDGAAVRGPLGSRHLGLSTVAHSRSSVLH